MEVRKGNINAVGIPVIVEWPAEIYSHIFKVGPFSIVVRFISRSVGCSGAGGQQTIRFNKG